MFQTEFAYASSTNHRSRKFFGIIPYIKGGEPFCIRVPKSLKVLTIEFEMCWTLQLDKTLKH